MTTWTAQQPDERVVQASCPWLLQGRLAAKGRAQLAVRGAASPIGFAAGGALETRDVHRGAVRVLIVAQPLAVGAHAAPDAAPKPAAAPLLGCVALQYPA